MMRRACPSAANTTVARRDSATKASPMMMNSRSNAVVEALHDPGVEQIVTAVRCPWQSGYCERVVGTLKRECLNHMIIFNEAHARRVHRGYLDYHHGARTHIGLDKDAPGGRAVDPPQPGPVRRRPIVGGLHCRYYRAAA